MNAQKIRGFSLIELIVVLVLLGLLAGVVVPGLIGRAAEGKRKVAEIGLSRIDEGLELFYFDVGRYPSTSEGLEALYTDPGVKNWGGPYLKRRKTLTDPWGFEYLYRSPGLHGDYDLWSNGADGAEGGEGKEADVTSW